MRFFFNDQIDELEYQLSLKSEKLATENNCEYNEQVEREDLDSLLTQEQERTQKLIEQCRVYNHTMEKLKSEKEALENETKELRKKSDELHVSIEDLKKQPADSEQRLKSSEELLHDEKEACEKLEKESQTLETIDCSVCKDLEKQSTEFKQVGEATEKQLKKELARNEELLKELEHYKTNETHTKGNTECVRFEAELQKIKNQKEELVKELVEERRVHETLRWVC